MKDKEGTNIEIKELNI